MTSEAEKKAKWMKSAKIIYWVVTLAFVAMMLSGGIAMLIGVQANLDGLAQLGYPQYLAKILGTAKVLGCIAILYGRFPTLKEWAYAGFSFNLIGASASHAFSGDNLFKVMTPIVILALVLVSRRQWKTGWM